MSIVKQYTLSPTFRSAASRALVKHVPSDLLYTFCGAMYDKSNKAGTRSKQDFYRIAVERVLRLTKNLRSLEEQYYVGRK
jgi:hypothetical protein